MYSQDVIEDVRFSNDIVEIIGQHTSLRQRGSSFVGLCPFHKESTPSFSVSPDKQLYHCFGCGASGTVYNFVMNIENMDFLDALTYLAERVNYTLPSNSFSVHDNSNFEKKQKLFEIHKLVARKFYDNLSLQESSLANDYLNKRKLSSSIRIKYGIGYSLLKNNDIYNFLKSKGYDDDIILESGLVIKAKNGNVFDRFSGRIMFPIIDIKGRIIGFGGRDITGNTKLGKYINSPDTPIFSKSFNLYSINFAKNTRKKEFVLVEGYMDVIALYQAGIHNVVASLGTAFSENHVKLLKKFANNVVLLFDSDKAGLEATFRAIPILTKNSISVKVCQLDGAKDPDEYIEKFGIESLVNELNISKSSVLFDIEQKFRNYNISDPLQKIEFIKVVSKIISELSSPVERDVFIKEVSNMTTISINTIMEEVKLISPNSNPIERSKLIKESKQVSTDFKLDDARNSILYIMASNLDILNILKDHVQPKHFINQFHIDFANLIFENFEKNIHLSPAEMTLKFSEPLEQQLASKIFMPKMDLLLNSNLESAINSQLKIVKKAYYDEILSKSSDMELVKSTLEEKKNFERIYIEI